MVARREPQLGGGEPLRRLDAGQRGARIWVVDGRTASLTPRQAERHVLGLSGPRAATDYTTLSSKAARSTFAAYVGAEPRQEFRRSGSVTPTHNHRSAIYADEIAEAADHSIRRARVNALVRGTRMAASWQRQTVTGRARGLSAQRKSAVSPHLASHEHSRARTRANHQVVPLGLGMQCGSPASAGLWCDESSPRAARCE
jgi:hypothetical protein